MKRSRTKDVLIVAGLAVILAVGLLGGRVTQLRGSVAGAYNAIKAVFDRDRVLRDNEGNYTSLFFLHHSVGQYLIDQGLLRERLREAGFDLYDQSYNRTGLFRPDGTPAGYCYFVPQNDTDPPGLLRIFRMHRYRLPLNALSGILQHEVILLKSCFTAVRSLSAADLERQKICYDEITRAMGRYPEKVFIILTSPPANPLDTDVQSAARARALADWLKSEESVTRHPNVYVFDLFDLLAGNDPTATDFNRLRSDYNEEGNSHPNRLANDTVALALVEFITDTVVEHLPADGRQFSVSQ